MQHEHSDPERRLLLQAVVIAGVAGASPLLALGSAADPARAGHDDPAGTPADARTAGATGSVIRPALAGDHVIQPLPFDPRKLRGLSERLLVSHHENNYGGAVKNLNKVEAQLAQVDRDTAPFVVGGLRQHELMFRNSATLHEAYFGNLGGSGKAGGSVAPAIASAYGSFDRWETQFRLTGASLGGGSGWAVLAYELRGGRLRTCWSNHHTLSLTSALPLLVMDMYEHAYQLDYGAAATKYIDAFFANVQWDEVDRRYEQARAMAQLLHA